MSAPFLTERPVLAVNTILLRDGRTVHLDDIATAAEGQAMLAEIDASILSIEDQLAYDTGRNGPAWRTRAEMALKKKRRSRPPLQRRIGELRRAERQAERSELGSSPKDARRKAFVDAAEELLTAEVFTELWTRAAERKPEAFSDTTGGAA